MLGLRLRLGLGLILGMELTRSTFVHLTPTRAYLSLSPSPPSQVPERPAPLRGGRRRGGLPSEGGDHAGRAGGGKGQGRTAQGELPWGRGTVTSRTAVTSPLTGGGGRRARVCTSVVVRWSVLLYGGCCELLWPVILEVWILVRLVRWHWRC